MDQFKSVNSDVERPSVVSQTERFEARKAHLAREKRFTRQRDALSAELRKLPMVRVDKEYTFDGPAGRVNLRDLFGKHRQLLVYHFMFDPVWDESCKSCSHFMDNAESAIV